MAKRNLEHELKTANADLEQVVMEAYRARKGLLGQARKEELKARDMAALADYREPKEDMVTRR